MSVKKSDSYTLYDVFRHLKPWCKVLCCLRVSRTLVVEFKYLQVESTV